VKPAPSVLIVDASYESREVLRLLLERRGARTIEAERAEEAVGLANRCHPDLIVFDAECDHSTGGDATSNLREVADRNDCPIVILGKVHELLGDWAADQIVAKPYHYEPLIRKINSLLAAA
jgi:DNA-binding response OmpR family regulator